jgi:tetratricopeptide (TPR) repeat protein
MKSRYVWLAAAGLAVLAAAISLIALPTGPDWTTASPEALAEFESGMNAEKKRYYLDALRHFERAVELDPGFVMARLKAAHFLRHYAGDHDRSESLYREVFEADIEGLHPHEQFRVEWNRAHAEKRSADADQLLDKYLDDHPNDSNAVQTKASRLSQIGDLDGSTRLYRRLVEIDPNFVLAYNELGYLSMQRGRFTEAEECFTTYRFIAPDQANPHDSLGELYIIQGRYEEAQQSLETALGIKPDFIESYIHLMIVRSVQHDFEGVRKAMEGLKAVDVVPPELLDEITRWIEVKELEELRAWREIVGRATSDSVKKAHPADDVRWVVHRAASELGDWQLAAEMESPLRERLEEAREKGLEGALDVFWPVLLTMEGVRIALQGDPAAAERRFREADAELSYRNSGAGLFKLKIRCMLVETLLAQGKDAEAHKLLSKIRAVNPTLVAEFEERGFKDLGLERG